MTTPDNEQRWGRYTVLEELGRGGMGIVFRAHDPKLDRDIAIKVLPVEASSDHRRQLRFKREAKLLAALNHPNIATIHDFDYDVDQPYIVQELVEGVTLTERIAEGPPPLAETVMLVRQIVAALESAHDKSVVHRDLKPDNIKITPAGLVKVLDFGIATMLNADDDRSTVTGGVVGTPGYISPEVLKGEPSDARADIWALGCILFECMTGERAFRSRNFLDTLSRDPNWEALPPDTPPELEAVVKRCLVKDAGERYASAAEITSELEHFRVGAAAQRTRRVDSTQPSSADEHRNDNLPRQLTSFVGRDGELASVIELISDHRLVTLTGAGGCGKTRLAVEAAAAVVERYADGVWLVELAPLTASELVPQAVASALGIQEQPGRRLLETITTRLQYRSMLLVLDNCEHLLEACAEVANALLRACPHLRIVATSREALGVDGEVNDRVPSLGLPSEEDALEVDRLRDVDSVALFRDRARRRDSSFEIDSTNAPHVIQICRALDGIPLAIELAASRIGGMSVGQISERLSDRFTLLTGGSRTALGRQRTLRATVDWSYRQLAEQEKTLLRGLSVFSGGWTLEAAEMVCPGESIESWEILDVLVSLADKSLIEVELPAGSGQTRYRMLEMIRQFAMEQAADDDALRAIRTRHRAFFLGLAEQSEDALSGSKQTEWLGRLDAERDNFWTSIRSSIATPDDRASGLRLVGALGPFWKMSGYWHEGRALCMDVLDGYGDSEGSIALGKALRCAGVLATDQGDYDQALPLLERSLVVYRGEGDAGGRAGALQSLGHLGTRVGQYDKARAQLDESLALYQDAEDERGTAETLHNLALVSVQQGQLDDAWDQYERSLALQRQLGNRRGVVRTGNNLARIAGEREGPEVARGIYEECLDVFRELGDRYGVAVTSANVGYTYWLERDYAAATTHYEQSIDIFRKLGHKQELAIALDTLGGAARERGDLDGAEEAYRESLTIREQIGDRLGVAESLESMGMLAAKQSHHGKATRLLASAGALRDSVGATASSDAQADLVRVIDELRSALGDEAFEREWDRGTREPVEKVVEQLLRRRSAASLMSEALKGLE